MGKLFSALMVSILCSIVMSKNLPFSTDKNYTYYQVSTIQNQRYSVIFLNLAHCLVCSIIHISGIMCTVNLQRCCRTPA